MKLSFAIAGPDYLDTVNKLLYATYHPSEPLTRYRKHSSSINYRPPFPSYLQFLCIPDQPSSSHLGLYKGLNSIRDVDRMVERKLAKNLTL